MSFFGDLFSRLFCLFLRVAPGGNYPPPLSKSEELDCFHRMQKGDDSARTTLIEHNLRLVNHIAKKYYSSSTPRDDLASLATIGLIKSVDTFNPDKGIKFATYAAKCMHNEILMYFRAQKKLAFEVPLSEQIDTDGDGGEITFADVIRVEDTIAEDVDLKIKSEKMRLLIRTVLDARERKILILRYGLHGESPLTQRQIAEKFGISRSYVSRIEKAAMEKIRLHMNQSF